MTSDIKRLLDAADALAVASGCSVVVVGGVARGYWATPRTTFDVDVVFGAPTADAALAAAEAAGLVAIPQEVKVLRKAHMTRLRLPDRLRGQTRLDVLLSSHPYYDRVLSRSVQMAPYDALRVASAEDIILMKLLADRPQDRVDVGAIIEAQGVLLDRDCLASEAKALEVNLPDELTGPSTEH